MPKKTKSSLKKKVSKLLVIAPVLAGAASKLLLLLKSEITMVRKKIICLFVLATFCLVLLMGAWMCMNALLVLFFWKSQPSLMLALFLAGLVNLALFMVIFFWMSHIKLEEGTFTRQK
ncbi:MAG: hypothetical protein A3E85_01010 [Gammaproteobacteria bacterium RIFCSPHIGHO2_12_FULL_45_12]|nr:MAG: hypothetical protein A3E85_01010 [Gammaproteobacteria bacterium RIFCSPHIGHO2_12_FULL_45_12]